MKFTLMCEDEDIYGDIVSKRTVEFNKETLDEIVEEFQLFLKGNGFYFDNLLIQDQNEDENVVWEYDEEGEENVESSPDKQDFKHNQIFYGMPINVPKSDEHIGVVCTENTSNHDRMPHSWYFTRDLTKRTSDK